MRTATVSLVTVTVFTTFLLAPTGIAARSVEIIKRDLSTLTNFETTRRDNSLTGLVNFILGDPLGYLKKEWFEKPAQDFINSRLESSYAALADIKKALDEAFAEGTGYQKEILTEVNDWLIELGPIVGKLNSAIMAAVNNGTKKDLGNIISRLVKTIETILPEVAKYIMLLGMTPGPQTTPVLLIFTLKIASNLIRAFLVRLVLRILEMGASMVSIRDLIFWFIPL